MKKSFEIGLVGGVVAAVLMLLSAVGLMGGSLMGMVDPPALIIIGGGIMCGVLVAFPLKDVLNLPSVIIAVLFPQQREVSLLVDQIVDLSETARRDGILALDARIQEINDPFLTSGIRMAVDGIHQEIVEGIMRHEINSVNARHRVGKGMISQLGKAAPVFGLIATLLGLVQMLAHMDPATIGHHMSVAILGTFYGATTANVLFLPLGEKLKNYNQMEVESMEIIVVGVLAIQNGENPRTIRLKLSTFLPPKLRKPDNVETES